MSGRQLFDFADGEVEVEHVSSCEVPSAGHSLEQTPFESKVNLLIRLPHGVRCYVVELYVWARVELWLLGCSSVHSMARERTKECVVCVGFVVLW